TSISVITGNVGFGGGGSYPQLDVFGTVVAGAPGKAVVTAANGIATGAVANLVDATLDIQGHDQTLAGLIGPAGFATNSSATPATLTLNVAGSRIFAGTINGILNLTKSGAGTQTLTGAGNYTGSTILQNGTLALVGANAWAAVLNNS